MVTRFAPDRRGSWYKHKKLWPLRLSPTYIVRIARIRRKLHRRWITWEIWEKMPTKASEENWQNSFHSSKCRRTQNPFFLLSSHTCRFFFLIFTHTIKWRSLLRKNNSLLKAAILSTFSYSAGNFSYIPIVTNLTANKNIPVRYILKITNTEDSERCLLLEFLQYMRTRLNEVINN